MKESKLLIIFVILAALFIFVTPNALAYDRVIVNSADWRDVYSGMLYANLLGTPNHFLVSTKHSTILLYSIPTTDKNILVLSSRERPFVVGYTDILRSRGYDNPEELRSSTMNLDLAKRLPDINKFVVIDDAYGYNAISVAPFSAADRSYVIFANRNNIDDVVSFFTAKNAQKIILYGQVDREVKDGLAQFNPETLNYGNRFDNNVEIVKRYTAIRPTKQVILTNGEFIESGIMSGADPVLFLGKQNVPDVVREFIKNSDIEVGILIGNELVNSATFVRRNLGISVFVKFAQGARQPTGAIATVEDLDRFPMPSYNLGIEVTSIVYNRASGALQVTYHNTVGLAEYFKSTITVRDGNAVKVAGDESALFLDKNEYKTILYSSDVDKNPLNLQGTDLSGDIFTIYGEGTKSLENTYQKSFQIDLIDVLDASKLNITGLYYDKVNSQFMVELDNTGDVGAYANVELVDLVVNGQTLSVGGDAVVFVKAGKSMLVPVQVEMVDADFKDNPKVKVRAYYGERELSRIKITEGLFPIVFKSDFTKYVVYGSVLLIILLLLFFLGTKKKCKHCGHANARGRKTCINCGHKF